MAEILLQSLKDRQVLVKTGFTKELVLPKQTPVFEMLLKFYHPDNWPKVLPMLFFTQDRWQKQDLWLNILGLSDLKMSEWGDQKPAKVNYTDTIADLHKFLLSLQHEKVAKQAPLVTPILVNLLPRLSLMSHGHRKNNG